MGKLLWRELKFITKIDQRVFGWGCFLTWLRTGPNSIGNICRNRAGTPWKTGSICIDMLTLSLPMYILPLEFAYVPHKGHLLLRISHWSEHFWRLAQFYLRNWFGTFFVYHYTVTWKICFSRSIYFLFSDKDSITEFFESLIQTRNYELLQLRKIDRKNV